MVMTTIEKSDCDMNDTKEQIFYSLEESKFCCRLCLAPIHEFKTVVTEVVHNNDDDDNNDEKNKKKKSTKTRKRKKHQTKKKNKEREQSKKNNNKPREIITVERPFTLETFLL